VSPTSIPGAHVCDAARESIRRATFATPRSAGSPKLKTAIAKKLVRDNGLDYSAAEITASCGGNAGACYNAMQALLDEGDEVVIPGRTGSATSISRCCGGKPRCA
jgi:aspartate aminotransferase